MTTYTHVDSPLGKLFLTSRDGKLSGLCFADRPHAIIVSGWVRQDDAEIFTRTAQQLEEYAAGQRQAFDLSEVGLAGSAFQVSVWLEIAKIPFGQTISYSELAHRSGRPLKDARAVGTATGKNPVCWLIPCHRVVGKNGALTGYGGGLPRKKALLDFEAARSSGRDVTLGQPSREMASIH